MIVANIEFPDNCPENCPVPEGYRMCDIGQQSDCFRCPVLVCAKDEDGFCAVEPEGYRKDWAELWRKLFNGEIAYCEFDLPL
jgi:hypothetical protein